MGTINLSNSKNRDAIVNTQSVYSPLRVAWLDEKGRRVQNVRLLRCTIDRDVDALIKSAGSLDKVSELLLKGDPEVDVESYGRALSDTSRVYVDPDKKIVHKIREFEIVKNPDGSVRERRPRAVTLPNTATETPLKWSGKLIKKAEVYNRFVFASKVQVVHVNGLTYDFLYSMAKELDEKQSLLLLGAGPKSNQPLIFQRGGTPYRGFLEGRIDGDKYCLILHLSNMELKVPEPVVAAAAPSAEPKTEEPAKPVEAEQKAAAPVTPPAAAAEKSTAPEKSDGAESVAPKKKAVRSKKTDK